MTQHRIDALGAHYIVEEVAPVLAYMGDQMIPKYHPQRPRIWQLTAAGKFPVGDFDVEREVLRIWEESVQSEESRVVRKPRKRKPLIDEAFWSGLEALERSGKIAMHGGCITLHITKSELAEATSHYNNALSEAHMKNLERNLEAYGLHIVD